VKLEAMLMAKDSRARSSNKEFASLYDDFGDLLHVDTRHHVESRAAAAAAAATTTARPP